MKKFILTSVYLFVAALSSNGQFHKIVERDLATENQQKFEALSIYYAESTPNFAKVETTDSEFLTIGVVKVLFWKDASGKEFWKANVVLDDSYKENLPTSYTFVASQGLVLFYQADAKGQEKRTPVDPVALKEYEELISDRLYKRIDLAGYRYVKSYDMATGKFSITKGYYLKKDQPRNTGGYKWPRTMVLGNPYHITNFEFDGDGKMIRKAVDY